MSFANTAIWPKKYENFHKASKQEKQSICDNDLLSKQIRIYLNNPSLYQYKRCEAYVKKNIPHLMDQFLNQFTPVDSLSYG